MKPISLLVAIRKEPKRSKVDGPNGLVGRIKLLIVSRSMFVELPTQAHAVESLIWLFKGDVESLGRSTCSSRIVGGGPTTKTSLKTPLNSVSPGPSEGEVVVLSIWLS